MEATKARDQLDDYTVAKMLERQNLLEDVKRRKADVENEKAAKRMQEEENKKASQQQPAQNMNYGLGSNSIQGGNYFGQQQPSYNHYGQQTSGHGQSNYPQAPQNQPQTYTTIQYQGSWGRPVQPPISFQPQQQGQPNPYMNPNYPPWYNPQAPKRGPW